jgi:hypothetical protein
VSGPAGKVKAGATFCDGTCALCSKAAHAPIAPSGGTVHDALCLCETKASSNCAVKQSSAWYARR